MKFTILCQVGSYVYNCVWVVMEKLKNKLELKFQTLFCQHLVCAILCKNVSTKFTNFRDGSQTVHELVLYIGINRYKLSF